MDHRATACASTRWPSRPPCAATPASSARTKRSGASSALLHDFDYERYPTLGDHPVKGCEHLTSLGYPDWVTRAILSHAVEATGVTRESRLEKTLYACDEMAGFVTAASLVRPSKSVLDLEASSVIKRMKDKAFARAVPREHLKAGADEIGLPLDQHITNVIRFMREKADDSRPARNALTWAFRILQGMPEAPAGSEAPAPPSITAVSSPAPIQAVPSSSAIRSASATARTGR